MGVRERITQIGDRLRTSSREFEAYLNSAANGEVEAVPLYGKRDTSILLYGRRKGVEVGAVLIPFGESLYKRTVIKRVGQGPFEVARHEFIVT